MSISKKQDELDEIKWKIGQELGFDPCGTFAYCKYCDKDKENPCENALNSYKKKNVKAVKNNQSKRKIGNADFRATVVDK